MNKILVVVLLIFTSQITGLSQVAPEVIDQWIESWPFDNPTKSDSILFWADKLEEESRKTDYPRGVNYAQRFRAYHHHFAGDVPQATDLYLSFLRNSREMSHLEDEVAAISDPVSYTHLTLPTIYSV